MIQRSVKRQLPSPLHSQFLLYFRSRKIGIQFLQQAFSLLEPDINEYWMHKKARYLNCIQFFFKIYIQFCCYAMPASH